MSVSAEARRTVPDERIVALGVLVAVTAVACVEAEPQARLVVEVSVETVAEVRDGLLAGESASEMHDGWSVQFDTYLVALGGVSLRPVNDYTRLFAIDEPLLVDLVTLPSGGALAYSVELDQPGRYDVVYYVTHASPVSASLGEDTAQHENARREQLTHFVEMTLSKPDGRSCPVGRACVPAPEVHVELPFHEHTSYGPCAGADGRPGIDVGADGGQMALTFVGDHLLYDRFEGAVERFAQAIVDCDLDGDGRVLWVELDNVPLADLPSAASYGVTGAPVTPVESMYDFLRAQVKIQGHLDGMHGCPVDGMNGFDEHSFHN